MESGRDKIIDYLENKIHENMMYECMPENREGYYYVPREAIQNMVDGLIPMVKAYLKKDKK